MENLHLGERHDNGNFGWSGEMELDNGLTVDVQIRADDCGCNPRKEFDNMGTMVCWHNNYDLGDVQPNEDPNDYWETLALEFDPDLEDTLYYWEWGPGSKRADCDERRQAAIERVLDKHIAVSLPLYLYDHSGLTMRTVSFHCPWDSGQVGFIYVTKEQAREEYSVKRVTKATIRKIEKYLVGEVKTYDDYLTGNVWGYIVEVTGPPETCPECGHDLCHSRLDDSCWGYYGDPKAEWGVLSEVNALLKDYGVKVDF